MIEKIKDAIKSNIRYFAIYFLIVLFLGVFIYIFKKEIINIDNIVYRYIVENIRNDRLTQVMKIITMFGSSIAIVLVSVLTLFFVKTSKMKFLVCVNPLLATIINQVLKFVVARKRPTEFFLIIEKGFSFPSGHSMVSVSLYGFIIYLIYTKIKSKKKYILISVLVILTILIMFSRIYLGVHYLSDVIAGCLISIAYLITYIKVINAYLERKK